MIRRRSYGSRFEVISGLATERACGGDPYGLSVVLGGLYLGRWQSAAGVEYEKGYIASCRLRPSKVDGLAERYKLVAVGKRARRELPDVTVRPPQGFARGTCIGVPVRGAAFAGLCRSIHPRAEGSLPPHRSAARIWRNGLAAMRATNGQTIKLSIPAHRRTNVPTHPGPMGTRKFDAASCLVSTLAGRGSAVRGVRA